MRLLRSRVELEHWHPGGGDARAIMWARLLHLFVSVKPVTSLFDVRAIVDQRCQDAR